MTFGTNEVANKQEVFEIEEDLDRDEDNEFDQSVVRRFNDLLIVQLIDEQEAKAIEGIRQEALNKFKMKQEEDKL